MNEDDVAGDDRVGDELLGGGPLGSNTVDPDAARDVACDLTASDSVCSPPATVVEQPPDLPEFSGAGGGSAIGTFLVVLLVAALVLAIVWIVVSVVRRRGDLDDDRGEDDLDEELDELARPRIVDDARPPERWRRAAADHRAAGRYRDAVRCEYRALVGELARAGIVDEIPGRTSGEERAQLRRLAPDVSPAFDEAADIFDEAWFDDDEVTAAHDARFVAGAQVVRTHVLADAGGFTRHVGEQEGS